MTPNPSSRADGNRKKRGSRRSPPPALYVRSSRVRNEMTVDKKILERLDDLIRLGEEVKGTRHYKGGAGLMARMRYQGDAGVNSELAHQWGTSCLNVLEHVFGKESHYRESFRRLFEGFNDFSPMVKALGVIKAAREDLANGYLTNVRRLLEAEVFDDFLAQAEHLSQAGYYAPAAVIAGVVLEDGLRKLCNRVGITLPPKPKLDQMNNDLARQGVYTKLVQKKIIALAEIRNKAAHGKWDEFTHADTDEMIRQTKTLMENFSSI